MILDRLRAWVRPAQPAAPCLVQPGMDYAREPDPAWQAMLDRLNPPETGMGRLVPWWDAGDTWQPIHRWFVLQVQDWKHVDPFTRSVLEGPHPRAGAWFNADTRKWEFPNGRGIDRLCYEAYHTLKRRGIRGWPRRFWVVQGAEGGHPYRLSRSEEMRWQAEGRVHPAPGDLPYAAFDQRVIHAITRYDLWQYAHGLGDSKTAHVTAVLRRAQADEKATRQLALKAWRELAEETAPELQHAWRKDGAHLHRWRPVGATRRRVDYDAERDAYQHDLNTEIPA